MSEQNMEAVNIFLNSFFLGMGIFGVVLIAGLIIYPIVSLFKKYKIVRR